MSQSEDYLDSLLNSITKAKTDVAQVQENAQKKQQDMYGSRLDISPEADFLSAAGIDAGLYRRTPANNSHPYLRQALSEDDFLKSFEEELSSDDPDFFIESFEAEIDEEERMLEDGIRPESHDVVDSLLNNIKSRVNAASKAVEEPTTVPDSVEENEPELMGDEPADSFPDLTAEKEPELESESDDLSDFNLDEFPVEEEPLEEGALEEEPLAEEEPEPEIELESAEGSEFDPDEMDLLDAVEYQDEDGAGDDDDLDLTGLLDDDDDLMDIQSLLDDDDDLQSDINEDVEDTEEAEEGGKKGLFKKGKKKKGEPGEDGEDKKGGILAKIMEIVFGPPDEDDIEPPVEIPPQYDEDGNEIELSEEEKAAWIAEHSGKKKKEKKEKKEKPKKEKPKEEPKKEKPKKPPKPPKEKKPKKVDNSPKIPLPIILVFLVLSASIIGVVLIGMNYMGLERHMKQANEYYLNGDYISAYEKLNGFDLSDEEVLLTRNRARVLADLQQCQDEYTAFMGSELYEYALDSLIKGIGRYHKFQSEAEEYGISAEYNEFANQLLTEAQTTFGLSEEDCMAIYNQPSRHYYTIEIRKVLIKLGLYDE